MTEVIDEKSTTKSGTTASGVPRRNASTSARKPPTLGRKTSSVCAGDLNWMRPGAGNTRRVQDAVQTAEAFPGDVDRTADVAWLGDVTRDDLHFGAERDEVTDPADPVTDTFGDWDGTRDDVVPLRGRRQAGAPHEHQLGAAVTGQLFGPVRSRRGHP